MICSGCAGSRGALRGVVGRRLDAGNPAGDRSADGLGVIDMAKIHEEVLASLQPRTPAAREGLEIARTAGAFLTESLSPFEITHRGFRDANRTLRQLNETLEDRNRQLAGANQRFPSGPAEMSWALIPGNAVMAASSFARTR